jgi:hypothetical protein
MLKAWYPYVTMPFSLHQPAAEEKHRNAASKHGPGDEFSGERRRTRLAW